MDEPERVPELVQAGQIHDGLAKERVPGRTRADPGAQSVRIGPDVDGGPSPVAHHQRGAARSEVPLDRAIGGMCGQTP